jgi:hypothetical protein
LRRSEQHRYSITSSARASSWSGSSPRPATDLTPFPAYKHGQRKHAGPRPMGLNIRRPFSHGGISFD